ncbi:hypothetical protein P5V15_009530 [Pogonomyrmex californicus]
MERMREREMKYPLRKRKKNGISSYRINNEERHTEARMTWSFLSLILYLCTTLNTLSLSNLVNAKATHSLGKCTNILDFGVFYATYIQKAAHIRYNVQLSSQIYFEIST